MALALKLKKVAPSADAGRPEVAELELEATEYRKLALEVDAKTAKMKILKAKLIAGASVERDKLLQAGEAPTSVKIPTADGNRVLIVYSERFRALDDENIEPLKDAFGDDYSLAVEETTKVAVTKGATLANILNVIGKAAAKKLEASGLITETTTVAPRKGAAKTIAAWFAAGKTEAATDLTAFVEAVGYSPSVKAK